MKVVKNAATSNSDRERVIMKCSKIDNAFIEKVNHEVYNNIPINSYASFMFSESFRENVPFHHKVIVLEGVYMIQVRKNFVLIPMPLASTVASKRFIQYPD